LNKLKDIQARFAQALLAEDKSALNLDWVDANHTLNPAQRISIYANSSREIISNTILGMLPSAQRLVGQEFLSHLIKKFIDTHSCDTDNYYQYTQTLPEFVAKMIESQSVPYLAEVLAFELARDRAFHFDDDNLGLDSLATLLEEHADKICFLLPSNASLIKSQYPIVRIWEMSQPDYQGEITMPKQDGQQMILVHRKDLQVSVDSLTASKYQFLALIEQRLCFGEICEKLSHLDVVNLLVNSVEHGWLTGYHLDH